MPFASYALPRSGVDSGIYFFSSLSCTWSLNCSPRFLLGPVCSLPLHLVPDPCREDSRACVCVWGLILSSPSGSPLASHCPRSSHALELHVPAQPRARPTHRSPGPLEHVFLSAWWAAFSNGLRSPPPLGSSPPDVCPVPFWIPAGACPRPLCPQTLGPSSPGLSALLPGSSPRCRGAAPRSHSSSALWVI